MQAIKITAYTDDPTQIEALKAVMNALKIRYELSNEKNTYDPEFVEKIKEGDNDLKNGRGRTMTLEELDSLWK